MYNFDVVLVMLVLVVLVAAILLIVSTPHHQLVTALSCSTLVFSVSSTFLARPSARARQPSLGQSLSEPAVVIIMMYKPVLGGALGIQSNKYHFLP